MSEPLSDDTAHVIVIVKMADDIHNLCGRVAAACWFAAIVPGVGVLPDLADGAWVSAFLSAGATVGLVLAGRDTWKRRAKYSRFVGLGR